MELNVILAGALVAGYGGYKILERSGFRPSMGRRSRTLSARKAPAPDKIGYEPVTLDVTPANLLGFMRQTAGLKRLGFRPVSDFAMTGWPDTFMRGFVHSEKPVYALIVERLGLVPHLEFHSLGEDYSALTTSSSEEAPDPDRPGSLRLQSLPGLSVDELYMQHLSALEDLREDGIAVLDASREQFFNDHRTLLVVEHELRKAKRALRTETLRQALTMLQTIMDDTLLRRYPAVETVAAEAPSGPITQVATVSEAANVEPETAPKAWGVGSSLLSRRLAARSDEGSEAPVAESLSITTVPALESTIVEEVSEPVAPVFELPDDSEAYLVEESAQAAGVKLPFESNLDEDPVRLPFEAPLEATVDPSFEVTVRQAEVESLVETVEPPVRLPFEIVTEERTVAIESPIETRVMMPFEATQEVQQGPSQTSAKPTCPHCGATLFSSLSSRCSKCKQAVR